MYGRKKTKAEIMAGVPHVSAKMEGCNTVRYVRADGCVVLRYHETDIVTRKPNGALILNSGGWKTPTTKARINGELPRGMDIYQDKGLWCLKKGYGYGPDVKTWTFVDGMSIGPRGGVNVKAGAAEAKRVARLVKMINAYGKEIAGLRVLPEPSGGDCWDCHLVTADGGVPMGEHFGTTDHLISHLKENYIHGSLIWNAIKAAGRNPQYARIMGFDQVARCVRRYFKSQLGIAQ